MFGDTPDTERWAHYLLRHIQGSYLGIDLSEPCVTYCKERFTGLGNANFVVNDGLLKMSALKISP